MSGTKAKWILAALRVAPLDRIHLMKALFLVWKRAGEQIPEYFEFVPYLYGPCSFEVYKVLDDMETQGFVVQPPHALQQWARYYLTERGRKAADTAVAAIAPNLRQQLEKVVSEIAQLGFYELLKRVYEEAPEFAANSVMRAALRP